MQSTLTEQEAINAQSRSNLLEAFLGASFYLCAALLTKGLYVSPFDDEIFTLELIEANSVSKLFRMISLGGFDLHGPTSYSLFRLISDLGGSLALMRLSSLLCTAIAIGAWHYITLLLIGKRSFTCSLFAVFLFGLTPLALGAGNSLRYYPMLAFFVGLFCALYIRDSLRGKHLGTASAIPLGLAASTSVLAVVPLLAMLLHRYAYSQRFSIKSEVRFYITLFVFSIPGILFAANRMLAPGGNFLATEANSLTTSIKAVAYNSLGVLGGYAIGLTNSWIALIYLCVFSFLAVKAISSLNDRKDIRIPVYFIFILVLLFPVVSALVVKPAGRSYLFLAPAIPSLCVIGLHAIEGHRRAVSVIAFAMAMFSIGIITNSRMPQYPFKRNLVVPYADLEAFVRANAVGETVIVSTDPTAQYTFRRSFPNACVSGAIFSDCVKTKGNFGETVVVIDGHSNSEPSNEWNSYVQGIEQRFDMRAVSYFGNDPDASLKTWLTKVSIDFYILRVRIFRSHEVGPH